jgi:hypothetical protein
VKETRYFPQLTTITQVLLMDDVFPLILCTWYCNLRISTHPILFRNTKRIYTEELEGDGLLLI